MKYKKKDIDRVKRRWGLENVNFFRGYRVIERPGERAPITDPIVICSFARNPKVVYRNRDDVRATARFTAKELEYMLERFADPYSIYDFKKVPRPNYIPVKPILFEPMDLEVETMNELKMAYLIHYLAEI